jgi:hypothetical protein
MHEHDRHVDLYMSYMTCIDLYINPLNAELNPICHLLALLGAHHILHVSRIRVKPSTHTPSKSFVNEISSPSTYTNTDGYTVSQYILCSFLR